MIYIKKGSCAYKISAGSFFKGIFGVLYEEELLPLCFDNCMLAPETKANLK